MGQGASAEAAPCQAAVRGDVAAVEQWLNTGGDPNAVHKSLKGTALQAAARGDHVECLELLLRNGADVNRATEEGTALHAAASRCCHRAVNLLLRWGANPAATNAAGMTAADLAANLGYANLAREILQKGGGSSRISSGSSSGARQQQGSLDAGAPAKPAAGGAAASPPPQRPIMAAGKAGQPSAQPSFSRLSNESVTAQPAGQPVPSTAPPGTAATPPPRPYAQQWPAAQAQAAPPPQARPQQWPGLQQPSHPQQAVPGAAQSAAAQQHATLQQQQQQQQQQAAAWQAAGPAVQPQAHPPAQPPARGWGQALAGAPPPQAQRPERPLKWWQQPQNQPPPPVAHSHPAYQAWLQQQAAWQQPQQQPQQAQQPYGAYGAPVAYPAGYGSGYATQPAAPAGFAYQLNPATGAWFLVPAAAAQQGAAAAGAYYPSLRPASPPRVQPVLAAHPQQAVALQPAAPAQAATNGSGAPPQQAAWAASHHAGGAAAPAPGASFGPSAQSAPSTPAVSSSASGSSGAAAKPPQQQEAPPAAPAAGSQAAAQSAASAPAELRLDEAAGEDGFEDINSSGSLLPSPSAPPATNSLLDRLFGRRGWQQPEDGGGGSSQPAGMGGAAASLPGAAAAAATAAAGGKGAAGAAEQREQPAEAASPKGTVEAMVALGLADSGVTDDTEQLQGNTAAAAGSGALDAAAAGRASSGSSSGGAEGAGSQGSAAAPSLAACGGGPQPGQLLSESSSDSVGHRLGVLRSNASCMVDISPWEVKWEDLRRQGSIGEGAFGAVYKAVWHETQVAVKVVGELQRAQEAAGPEAQLLSSPTLQNLRLECGLMASMRHPNVVQFLGVCACPPAIVTEYCGRGSLTQVLQEGLKSPHKAAQLTWQRRLRMAIDAAKGMLYLHKRGIVHRDLKSPNLLVDTSWVVKVADFNLSKVTEGAALNPSSTMGNVNPRWLAPEILEEHPATCQSDVYAFGITMWELMTWRLPWGDAQIWTIMGQIMSGNRPPVPEPAAFPELPGPGPFPGLPAWLDLMQRCWHQDPGQRPDFAAVIAQLREIQAVAAGSQAGGAAQRQASGP